MRQDVLYISCSESFTSSFHSGSKKKQKQIENKLTKKHLIQTLSGSPAKSGPLDFGTKDSFPSFYVS